MRIMCTFYWRCAILNLRVLRYIVIYCILARCIIYDFRYQPIAKQAKKNKCKKIPEQQKLRFFAAQAIKSGGFFFLAVLQ